MIGAASSSTQRGLERAAAAVVEAVDRALGLAEAIRDLARGEPRDVAQHEHLALLLGEPAQRLAQALRALEAGLVVALVARADLLDRDLPAGAHVVEREVARHGGDPGGERHVALLVAVDRRHQLREHVLRDVLGLVAVADDPAHVRAHVVGEAHVEEVQRAGVAGLGARHGAAHEIRLVAAARAPGRTVRAQLPML